MKTSCFTIATVLAFVMCSVCCIAQNPPAQPDLSNAHGITINGMRFRNTLGAQGSGACVYGNNISFVFTGDDNKWSTVMVEIPYTTQRKTTNVVAGFLYGTNANLTIVPLMGKMTVISTRLISENARAKRYLFSGVFNASGYSYEDSREYVVKGGFTCYVNITILPPPVDE